MTQSSDKPMSKDGVTTKEQAVSDAVELARQKVAREVEGDSDNPLRVAKANDIYAGLCDDEYPEIVAAKQAASHPLEQQQSALHFVFDGLPGPECGRFVECETPDGRSVNAGEWHERADGLWELRVPIPRAALEQQQAVSDDVVERLDGCAKRARELGKNVAICLPSDVEQAVAALTASGMLRMREALEIVASWLERWASHVGNCAGGDTCSCGLTRIRYDARTALQEDGRDD